MKKYIFKQFNKKIINLALILLVSGCSTYNKVFLSSDFSTIYTAKFGGSKQNGFKHIKDNESYIKTIDSLKIDASNFGKLALVDFNSNDILILYLGEQNNSGFSIDIESIHEENEKIIVTRKINSPSEKDSVKIEITSPYSISIIPKTKKVTFIE